MLGVDAVADASFWSYLQETEADDHFENLPVRPPYLNSDYQSLSLHTSTRVHRTE